MNTKRLALTAATTAGIGRTLLSVTLVCATTYAPSSASRQPAVDGRLALTPMVVEVNADRDWLNNAFISGTGQIGHKDIWKFKLSMAFERDDRGSGMYMYTAWGTDARSIPLVGERRMDANGVVRLYFDVVDKNVVPECHGEKFVLTIAPGTSRANGIWSDKKGRKEEVWLDLK